MGNLASTYSALGKHADALALEERVLEFRRRVLPTDHPSIGEGCLGEMRCMRLGNCVGRSVCFDLTSRRGHEQPCYDVLCA
jgi:hypothetical protein